MSNDQIALSLDQQLHAFPEAMVLACHAALDDDIFYQDDFVAYVLEKMGGHGVQPVMLEVLELDATKPDFHTQAPPLRKALAQRVSSAPRGTYAVIARKDADAVIRYSVIISDGSGDIATGTRFDAYPSIPTPDHVVNRMISYEIYSCRKLVERSRLRAKDLKALSEFNFHIGMELKNYRHPGEVKPYSKAVVQKIFPEQGSVELLLIRRGSSKRFTTVRGCHHLSIQMGLLPDENKHPFVIIKHITVDGQEKTADVHV